MNKRLVVMIIAGWFSIVSSAVFAGESDFHPGPVIHDYGKIADVDIDVPIPDGSILKVAFDLTDQADAGEVNRGLDSIARFINMHVANGVPIKNIQLAVVVHGGAVKDLTVNDQYQSFNQSENANANVDLVKILLKHGVKLQVCGQSAAYQDVKNEHLLPGVKMALSAMTAHALLQNNGYTINPF